MSRLMVMFRAAFLMLAFASSAHGASAPLAELIQQGFNQGDATLLRKARGQLLAQLANDPGSASLHGWVAIAAWRAVPLLAQNEKDVARRTCDEGIQHADAALKAAPAMGLALALKAALQGMSIRFAAADAMTLGPEMAANMERAAKMSPNDPRVHLLDGVNTLHTPAFFGGGPDKALVKLKRSLELFAAEAPDSTGERWGRDDAHAWAGRAEARRENFAAAKQHYLDALSINPGYGWVKTTLLPEAETALAKGKSGS